MIKRSSLSLIVLSILLFVLFSCAAEQKQEALSADNIAISYNEKGDGKPALVFVHGWSCDKDYWKYQVPHFSKEYRVVAIDLAGHGESGLERESWTMKAFGQDVVAVLNELNIEQAILIGHSMGGAVIMEAAEQMPDRVIGLVGVDTYHDVEAVYTQEQFDEYFAPFSINFDSYTQNFVRSMFPPDADSVLVEQIVNDMSSAPPDVATGAMFQYFNYDHISKLEALKIPVVCINADMWPTNVEGGKKYNSSFELKVMPGIGHFVMLEDPDSFNKILEETVNEIVNK